MSSKIFSSKSAISIGLVLVLGLVAVLAGCSSESEKSSSSKSEIVTSFYPIQYVVSRIVEDDYEVVNLTPVGVEPHDLELNASSTEKLLEAPLAIVMGEGFQPAIEKTAENRDGLTLSILETLQETRADSASVASLAGFAPTSGDEGHSEDDGHSAGENDPHIWLDPVEMQPVVESITSALIALDDTKKQVYEERSEELQVELAVLDELYATSLKTCDIRTFVTSHDAFSRLADRYELEQESIAGISPDAEPTANRIEELRTLVNEKDIEVIFTEELVSQKVSKTLSEEANVRTEILSPLEGLTKEQVVQKKDYFSIMRTNLENLVSALRCD